MSRNFVVNYHEASQGAARWLTPPLNETLPVHASWVFGTRWEDAYDGVKMLLFSDSHFWIGAVAVMIYLACVFVGTRIMRNRKPFDLLVPLKYWNLALAIFSIVGTSRLVPYLALYWYHYGTRAILCSPPLFTYGRKTPGLWTLLFIYSKYVELFDTMFIVLRKKRLSFLHWYHHATVLLYTWDAFTKMQPPGLAFCAMNFCVHSVMYSYYYLAARNPAPPKWGLLVTLMQISQMVAGVAITLVAAWTSWTLPSLTEATRQQAAQVWAADETPTCFLDRQNILLAACMYATYLYLFAEFFLSRYIFRSRPMRPRPLKAAQKEA